MRKIYCQCRGHCTSSINNSNLVLVILSSENFCGFKPKKKKKPQGGPLNRIRFFELGLCKKFVVNSFVHLACDLR